MSGDTFPGLAEALNAVITAEADYLAAADRYHDAMAECSAAEHEMGRAKELAEMAHDRAWKAHERLDGLLIQTARVELDRMVAARQAAIDAHPSTVNLTVVGGGS